MAKPTKKKAVSSPATNNKKRAVKAKKLQQPSWGFNIDFDPVTQVNHSRALETPPLPRTLEFHASPGMLAFGPKKSGTSCNSARNSAT
jgi:hypothetical protein